MGLRAPTAAYAKGNRHMSSHSAEDPESTFESQLIDLDAVPLTALRDLDSRALRRALHHVVQQARRPSKTRTSCSSLTRID